MSKETFRVAKRSFNSKNVLNIGAVIEKDEHSINEVIFVEVAEYGGRGIVMKFTAIDLRALTYAMRTVLKTGASSYLKHNRSGDTKSELWVHKGEKSGYFINAKKTGKGALGVQFDQYRWVALIDSLSLLADETEKALYFYQNKLSR
ncbi:MAG: hypothetical protein U9Q62_08475 [Campylobacterota bacterium]|nr:hypothetical protein [Campylobacterota bacterium]